MPGQNGSNLLFYPREDPLMQPQYEVWGKHIDGYWYAFNIGSEWQCSDLLYQLTQRSDITESVMVRAGHDIPGVSYYERAEHWSKYHGLRGNRNAKRRA